MPPSPQQPLSGLGVRRISGREVQEKKRAYKRWQRTQNKEDKRDYKEKAKQAKTEVARAKRLAWESWSEELNSSGQQKEIFKIAKQMMNKKLEQRV